LNAKQHCDDPRHDRDLHRQLEAGADLLHDRPVGPHRLAEIEGREPDHPVAELVDERLVEAEPLAAGLSQAELAARMGTSQSTIARLESGQTLPSTKTLLRYAQASGSKFHVRLPAA
jgi:ribosome-binding protein aMBF1 (putative translation factor)